MLFGYQNTLFGPNQGKNSIYDSSFFCAILSSNFGIKYVGWVLSIEMDSWKEAFNILGFKINICCQHLDFFLSFYFLARPSSKLALFRDPVIVLVPSVSDTHLCRNVFPTAHCDTHL